MPSRTPTPRAVKFAVIGLAVVEAAILLAGVFAVRDQKRDRASSARPDSVSRVAFDPPQLPVIPGARHHGVCFVATVDTLDARAGRDTFDALRFRGVTWISQTPFGWQARADEPGFRMITDGHVHWGERDSGLASTARLARASGIRTLLKPHLWLRDHGDGKWVGSIAMKNEADWAKWFARYEEFAVHYARLAEALGMEAFCVGTELEGTTHRTEDWRRVIAAVRRVYHGRLTYAANWSGEFERIGFWDDLDWIGIQAYFPLSDKEGASVDELVAGWAPHVAKIEAVQRRFARPVLFTEIGYKSSARATVEPWTWTSSDRYDPEEQARAYEAAFRVLWDKPWCAGMYWWKWFPDNRYRERSGRDRLFTPQDKPAEDVLRKWYRDGSTPTGAK